MRMKKIFSLIVACALVMSVTAVPFTSTVEKGEALKRVSVQKVNVGNAGKVSARQSAQKPAKSVQLQGKKQVATTITLDFPALKYVDHVADAGWWQLYGSNADGYSVTFSNDAAVTTAAGTYDMSVMDPSYTKLSDGTNTITFTAGTIVLSFDANGKAQLTANVTGSDGNTYVITAAEKVVAQSTNVITLSYADGKLNVTTTNDDPYFLIVESLADYNQYQSDFTQASLDAEIDDWISSAVYYGYLSSLTFSGSQLIDMADFYESLNGNEMAEGDYVALAAPVDDEDRNGNTVYSQFNFVPAPFVPTGETINVVFKEPVKMSYYSSGGDWWVRAAREGLYAAALDMVNNDAESPVGTYEDLDDFLVNYTYVTVYADSAATSGKKMNTKGAEAIVTEANDTITFEANLLASDGNVYALQMFFAKPVALNEETIEAENLSVEAGWFSVYAEASDSLYGVSLSFTPENDNDYTGEYTIGSDVSGSITILADGTKSDVYSGWFIIDIDEEGQYTLEGEVLCFNNTQYTLNLTYVLPEQSRAETITITEGVIALYDGAWQAVGFNADQSRYVSVAAYADTVAGTYGKYDLALSYTYVVALGADTLYYTPLTADLVVTFNEADSTFTITGTMLAQNDDDATDVPFFTINMSGKQQASGSTTGGIQYDEQEADFNGTFTAYNEYDDYLAQYGIIMIEAENDNDEYVLMYLVANAGDATLMPGQYSITSSWEDETWAGGTVIQGMYDASSTNGGVYPSYAATLIEQSGTLYLDQIWFFVSGSVTVNSDYSIDVAALNSYGKTIVAHMTGRQTAVEEVKAESVATKRIENGMLLIERNGEVYNAQGIRQ